MSYFLDNGYNLSLGRQIGRGGEGSVFAVNNMPNHVAKIYHNKLSPQHEQKLRSMVSLVTPQLSNNATWPEGLIYKKGSQSLQGILIPYVKGH
jgi:DNA-binding helix-hairpin-helix protein with protein kinase domain